MANEAKSLKKGLKEKLDAELHPPESEDARRERLALEALVALLDSENETTRLQAAQAILARPKAPPAESAATGLIKKLAKKK